MGREVGQPQHRGGGDGSGGAGGAGGSRAELTVSRLEEMPAQGRPHQPGHSSCPSGSEGLVGSQQDPVSPSVGRERAGEPRMSQPKQSQSQVFTGTRNEHCRGDGSQAGAEVRGAWGDPGAGLEGHMHWAKPVPSLDPVCPSAHQEETGLALWPLSAGWAAFGTRGKAPWPEDTWCSGHWGEDGLLTHLKAPA